MTGRTQSTLRVLAIDPTTRGFGFVVFEGMDQLIDWGIAKVRTDKGAGCLKRIGDLVDCYHPDIIVTENPVETRRCRRVRELLVDISDLASQRGLKTRTLSRRTVRKAFVPLGAETKPQIAAIIAERFPELAQRLPAPRKAWMTEAEGMSVFDAVSFGLVYYQKRVPQGRTGLKSTEQS